MNAFSTLNVVQYFQRNTSCFYSMVRIQKMLDWSGMKLFPLFSRKDYIFSSRNSDQQSQLFLVEMTATYHCRSFKFESYFLFKFTIMLMDYFHRKFLRRLRLSTTAKIVALGWIGSLIVASLPLAGISSFSTTRYVVIL